MKKLFVHLIFILLTFPIVTNSLAQGGKKRKGEPAKTMTDAEKTVVIEIFRKLDPASYYLELNKGAEIFGSRTIVTQDQLLAIRSKRVPAGFENYTIGSYHYEMGMVFIIKTRAPAELEALFGTDAARLQSIINKYTSG